MPVVGIPIHQLKTLIGRELSNKEIEQCCRELGCDVEELTQVSRLKCARCGAVSEYLGEVARPKACENCGQEFGGDGDGCTALEAADVIRLDLLADRPDNFDAGGLARSIRGYLDLETGLARYEVEDSPYSVRVDKGMADPQSYRPRIVCAVVHNLSFDDESLKSLMKLQENLHWALGRDRKFASIGVYNLDTISEQLHYRPVGPDELRFAALGAPGLEEEHQQTPQQILEQHPKGMAYAHLLQDLKKYPLLIDDQGTVLSMPPIINSEDTRVTVDSKNVFIDVTGLSEAPIKRALAIIVTSLKAWFPKCRIGRVRVQYADQTQHTPQLEPTPFSMDFEHCRKLVGVPLKDEDIIACLERMRYAAHKDQQTCRVQVPAYRNDILHEHDLIEDVAIAYGYKNIEPLPVHSFTVGNILPKQAVLQQLREILAGLGFLEVLNIMLTSEARAYEKLRLPVEPERVIIENPISVDQTIVRSELMSGLLETLALNTSHELPQHLFEVGEVILCDPKQETGTREDVCCALAMAGFKSGFADAKSTLTTLLRETALEWTLKETSMPCYLEGRAATVVIRGKTCGHIGEIHPEVLEGLRIFTPVVCAHINLNKAGVL